MKIEVKVFPVNHDTIKANAAITIDDLFVIKDFKVIQGKKELFVSKPSKMYNNEYHDTVYLLDKAKNDSLNALILSEYAKAVDNNTI